MKQEILHIMPMRLRGFFEQALEGITDAEEIRIRVGQPPEIRCTGQSIWLLQKITTEDMEEMLTFISHYSLYAYEEEMRQGYLTVEGGSRIGFAGQVRMEDRKIVCMTNIRFLNIRIARERKGCAEELLPWLYEDGEFLNTILISRPGVGKTTLLRDCVRMISNGAGKRGGKKVSVIDERSEIAACHLGVPQNDLGRRTDVLDGCPKQIGMRMALRSMSPEVIAVDELGGKRDAEAVTEMILSGCRILGTMHGEKIEHVMQTEEMAKMYKNRLFQRYVILEKQKDGRRNYLIYDQECQRLC